MIFNENKTNLSKHWNYLIPFIFCCIIAMFLWRDMEMKRMNLPTALTNNSTPEFNLPQLIEMNQGFTKKQLQGKVVMLHAWASWCSACMYDHPFMMQIARSKVIPIYGIAFKDDPEAVKAVLQERGNPYTKIDYDPEGSGANEWNIYGIPKTMILDAKGDVRYTKVGALTPKEWKTKILPLIKKLQAEAKNV